MKLYLPVVLFALVASPLIGQQPAEPAKQGIPAPTLANVSYGAHERQVLDFWRAPSDSPTPVLFFIHGGGWVRGDKSGVGGAVQECLKAGISVVSINYRYSWQAQKAGVMPPVEWPVRDAARALQFVRTKASEWNINKTRIGASGGSAGACSSLWLAFHKDLADSTSADPVARESTRLWCAAVDGAQTSLDPAELMEWTPNSRYGGHAFGFMDPDNLGTRDTRFAEFLERRADVLKHIQEYSPMTLATKDAPPVYLKYGEAPALGQNQKDPTHTSNYGVKLQEKLQGLGVECELVHAGAPSASHPSSIRYIIDKLTAPAVR
jgi:acetyl esterase/lipase